MLGIYADFFVYAIGFDFRLLYVEWKIRHRSSRRGQNSYISHNNR